MVSIAKRYVGATGDFFELVSDGNMSLIRAAEKFDISRGNRFSTYASWAIMKNFARAIATAFRQRDRFCTGYQEMLSSVEGMRESYDEQHSVQVQRESQVQGIAVRVQLQREQESISSSRLYWEKESASWLAGRT